MRLGLLMDAVSFGNYISIAKVLAVLVVLLVWTRLLTWIDKDAPAAHLPRIPVNMGLTGGLVLGFLAFFILPGFWMAFGALMFMFAADVGAYLVIRQQKVGLADLGTQLSGFVKGLTKRKEKEVVAGPGQVLIMDRKSTAMETPEGDSPDRAGYDAAQTILTTPLSKGAELIEVQPAEGGVLVRYQVDGVLYPGDALDKAAAAAAITLLKRVAGMDLNDKRKPQAGTMKASMGKTRRDLLVETRGSSVGEQMTIHVDFKKRHGLRLGELGMFPEQLEMVKQCVAENSGVVLVAAPKTQGLTSMLYALIREHDAFLTHIHTIERAADTDLEGITQNDLPVTATPDEEAKLTEWVVSTEPDVILMSPVESPASAAHLARFAAGGKRVYVGLQAGNTLEAINQWRKLVGDDKQAMKHLTLVMAGRVVRRLCSACKAGYRPDPETLRKLNIDSERVSQLYQARTQPVMDAKGRPVPCNFCNDLRFRGRFGVYEILSVNDEVRQVILGGGSPAQLKVVFRKQRGRYLQEQAFVHLEKGETSVQEVLRVLRVGEAPASAGSSRGRTAAKTPGKVSPA